MEDIAILSELYKEHFGVMPESVTRLSGGGGDRQYYRLTRGATSCIGTKADAECDAAAFVGLTQVFGNAGINVPHIYASTPDRMYYLQQDLGDEALFNLLKKSEGLEIARKALESLAMMQTVPEEKWQDVVAYKPFSKRQAMWDLNYFKYKYLKSLAIPFDEDALEDDFKNYAAELVNLGDAASGFMMRDCQSRNVMVKDGEPYLIDYQGGRKGPLYYDPVSFLWQARAGFSEEERGRLLGKWREKIMAIKGELPGEFDNAIQKFAFFRTLQVLGAYGFRGLEERRAHFIESIPPALDNLKALLYKDVADGYPELKRVCRYAVEHSPVPPKHEGLQIKVFSFSYKKGYPLDRTGNGGGFMFDCRGMHNPGRYDEYKTLTAFDQPVRDFLESKGEVQVFVQNAWDMVRPSIECYLRRGFTDLQIGFGCTGGRHRSAYCADKLGKKIARGFPEAEVEIIHRELGIREEFNTHIK